MHALSSGYDVPSDELISILAENHDVPTYEKWYTNNPKGLCEFDLMALELILNLCSKSRAARIQSLCTSAASPISTMR